jgi:uncharacterized protein YbjT (DUF2867 family)
MRAPARTLVCGATGFVGRALTRHLLRGGIPVRVLVRAPERARAILPAGVEVVGGDVVGGTGLEEALESIYLIHSMGSVGGPGRFAALDRRGSEQFADAARRAGVDRIVYLGGLGDAGPGRSEHLASRREVGEILRAGGADLTQLRAGIVVGAGGSSFEMMVQLVERLPVMLCPRWIDCRCQPIALSDLVHYLAASASDDRTRKRTFDVGGPDTLTYGEMLMRVGRLVGRRPCLVVLPRFTPGLSAHWVGFITDVPSDLARPVIDSMYVEAVCRENRIREILPNPLLGFDEAVQRALDDRGSTGPHRLLGGHPAGPFEGRTLRLLRA